MKMNMNNRASIRADGFTLIEVLVCIAIITMLAGIAYVGFAPVRLKASETRCISNLRQIGLAIQMYRNDNNGGEPPEAVTITKLGLPPAPIAIRLQPYLRSDEVWKCKNEYWPSEAEPPRISYQVLFTVGENANSPVPPFSKTLAGRGDEMPLLADPHHGTRWRRVVPTPETDLMLILRLGGQVERRWVPRKAPAWEF